MAVQASLVYTAPDGSKKDLMLHVGEDTTIGRHPNCSLTISQPSVSRRHARLWFDQGVWFVEDLQSSNGTFVNNRRINRAQLTEGDELRCGDFLLTYGVEERTRAVPTPERREKLPPAPPSPQVSNRATVGLDSPPPIPEAPRLNAPRQAAPSPAPAPSAPSTPPTPVFAENSGRESELEAELAKSRQSEADLRTELEECRSQLENALSEHANEKENVARANDALKTAEQERDSATRDVKRMEEQRTRLDDEINTLSTTNRDLTTDLETLRNELEQLRSAGVVDETEGSIDTGEQDEEIKRLEDALAGKDKDLAALQRDLEELQLKAPTQATPTTGSSGSMSETANEAFASHSSELRVALKAASGFVQEVKDVFASVAAMEPAGEATQSVLDVQEAFEENGGMDPVSSLEVAFDKMEHTARQLRRLSKGR